METNNTYELFGSADSLDLDIVFFTQKLGAIQENLELTKSLATYLELDVRKGKKINANLASLSHGTVSDVYKGTGDELNNALLATYNLHPQQHELLIKRTLARDKELKLLRTMRKILSSFSRTVHRQKIKSALKNGFPAQLIFLKNNDLTNDEALAIQHQPDIWKIIIFAIAQVLALEQENELYTKKAIAIFFPELESIIYRHPKPDRKVLRRYLNQFIEIAEYYVSNGMRSAFEYKYQSGS